MKAFARILAALALAGLLAGCGAKKPDDGKTRLFGAHIHLDSVPSTRCANGKMLDIDAGVTVLGTEFGFVASGNGSYIKGVRGMDPATLTPPAPDASPPVDPEAIPRGEPQAQTPSPPAP